MADGRCDTEITENPHNLTIIEDQNYGVDVSGATKKESEEVPYKYGYPLPEYYKLCLQYYHKGKRGTVRIVSYVDL